MTFKFWTWIPVILTIEPANMAGQLHLDVANQEEQNWDFPRTLAPLTIREAKDKGVEYIMAARIFKNHNHFIARSIIPTSNGKTGVFTHDGMKHAGFSQLERGSVDELMTGSSPPVPPGYFTYAVIYRLRGGASAQDYFASRQLELCKKKLDVDLLTPTFLVPGFREMTENERIWVTSHYSSQRHSWEFCRSQQNFPHEENSKVNLATQNYTGRVSLPPISALPEDFDAVEKAIINSTDDEFFSPAEDIPPLSSSPPPPTPLPILCRCGADSDGHRDEIEEPAVECVLCHKYSHVACQTYRLSASLPSPFKCHLCNLEMPRRQQDLSTIDATSTKRRSRRL